jgi:4'-phosphopantetheinyl transferase
MTLPVTGEIHLWLFSLEQMPECVESLRPLLCDDEQIRAGRFYTTALQQSFIVGRAVLRLLLGHYLGLPAEEVRFAYGKRGKPFLLDHRLQFNLAHSDTLALVGFTWDAALGVDLEAVRLVEDLDQVARSFFAPDEVHDLFSLPAAQRFPAFYSCWTRKEAYIKAESSGLHLPLDSFEVTLLPDDPVRLRRIGSDLQPDRHWSLLDIPISADFRAAAVLHGQIERVSRWIVS